MLHLLCYYLRAVPTHDDASIFDRQYCWIKYPVTLPIAATYATPHDFIISLQYMHSKIQPFEASSWCEQATWFSTLPRRSLPALLAAPRTTIVANSFISLFRGALVLLTNSWWRKAWRRYLSHAATQEAELKCARSIFDFDMENKRTETESKRAPDTGAQSQSRQCRFCHNLTRALRASASLIHTA